MHAVDRPLVTQEKNTIQENYTPESLCYATTTTSCHTENHLATALQPHGPLPLPSLLRLDHHIASCSRTSTTIAIACYGCLAGPIACLDCTRVVDDLVVVLEL